ncbi:MAG TPA: hypothetical protein VJ201_07570 [Candidatus Babeliales bacterium]|nr:hypothetical protein [Candidatus Babeliales bacterium]
MTRMFLETLHLPSFAMIFLFVIYYAISILAITCLLMFSTVSIRMRHILAVSIYAGFLSVIASGLIIIGLLSYNGASRALIFTVSNTILQCFFLWFSYGTSAKSTAVPLIVGNSIAYLLTFSQALQLM